MSLQIETTPLAPPPPSADALVSQRESCTVAPGLDSAFLAIGNTRAALDRLATGESLCVSTGQQPGLLTGPLYSVYKALSAAAYARWIEAATGRSVVPVFWIAGDDHDFAEANHVHALSVTNEVETLVLRERGTADPQHPLYRELLGTEVDEVLDRAAGLLPETDFTPDVMKWLRRHWRADVSFADAFAASVAEILEPYGVVVFQSTTEAAKVAMAPFILSALERADELNQALRDRASELASAQGSVPVHVDDDATLVMLEAAEGRDRLVWQERGLFSTRRSGETFSLDQLRQIAADEPTRLSPNVLLRPVIEAAVLPTVAYVGGPGELQYLPQCAPVYELLQITPQTPVPRWSGRVIEAKVAKVLEKYEVTPDDLSGPEGKLEASIAKRSMPKDAEEALAALREAIGEQYQRLEAAAVEIDPTMKKAVSTTRNTAFSSVADLEKRLVAHLKKQNDIVAQQIAKATVNLFPLNKPQERVLSLWHYLARYGNGFLDDVYAHVTDWVTEPASEQ